MDLGHSTSRTDANGICGIKIHCITIWHTYSSYLCIKLLKQVLKQQRQQLSGQLQPLVAVVVAVVDLDRVAHRQNDAPHHQARVHRLDLEVPVDDLVIKWNKATA